MSVSIRMRWVAAVCGSIVAASAFAQSEPPATPPEEPKPPTPAPAAEPPAPPKPKSTLGDPPLHRWGGLTLAVDVWGPQLANRDDDVAIVNDGVSTRLIDTPADASAREHLKVWWHLPKDLGAIRIEYDSMRHDGRAKVLDPGNFVFGELLAFPLLAGVADDGLADGFSAASMVKTREARVEYERLAIDTPKTKAWFHFGYHTLDNARSMEATYYALLPTFPPFLPPNFEPQFNPTFLFPIPDTTSTTSDFSGHGLGGGFDVEWKFHPRVSLRAGLSLGVLKGSIETRYQASTSTYFFNLPEPQSGIVPVTFEEVLALIAQGQDIAERIFQEGETLHLGLRDHSRLAYEFDLSMAVEFKIWRSLNASVGLRELAYVDVSSDVKRDTPIVQPNGSINFQTVSQENKTVGYEGYFVGMSYRF